MSDWVKEHPAAVALAVVIVIVAFGFSGLFWLIDEAHATQENDCVEAYGEGADWLGSFAHGDHGSVRVCELPDGDIRLADPDGKAVTP